MDLENRKVTVMGLGTHGGGCAAVRYLVDQGAIVTVTDLAHENQLKASLEELSDLSVHRYCLGQHVKDDFLNTDLVVINPAVKPQHRLVELANNRHIRITTEMELFLQACPAQIVAITGTNGKTTTASMLAHIMQANGRRHWLGGNIGNSLLPDLPNIKPEDWVILELSSFQLAQLRQQEQYFQIAMITNIHPNHLDWHDNDTDYINAKLKILSFQHDDGIGILNLLDPKLQSLKIEFPEDLSFKKTLGQMLHLEDLPILQVVGSHNQQNAALAATAAKMMGCQPTAIHTALASFVGLPHRIQFLEEKQHRHFYNDSKSTTPEATIAALTAMKRPIWLLVGGKDKGADYQRMLETAYKHAKGIAIYGEIAETLMKQLSHSIQIPDTAVSYLAETMDGAFNWCLQHSKPEDAILLSPACASFDLFHDYIQRGEHFISLVQGIAGET